MRKIVKLIEIIEHTITVPDDDGITDVEEYAKSVVRYSMSGRSSESWHMTITSVEDEK
jgi:hypothetical protein